MTILSKNGGKRVTIRGLVKPFGKPEGTKRMRDGLHEVPYTARPKHPSFRPLGLPRSLRQASSYVVDYKRDRIVQIDTREPDGAVIGWDTCRGCHQHVNWCRCAFVVPPSYVTEWMPKPKLSELYGVSTDVSEKEAEVKPKPKKRGRG